MGKETYAPGHRLRDWSDAYQVKESPSIATEMLQVQAVEQQEVSELDSVDRTEAV